MNFQSIFAAQPIFAGLTQLPFLIPSMIVFVACVIYAMNARSAPAFMLLAGNVLSLGGSLARMAIMTSVIANGPGDVQRWMPIISITNGVSLLGGIIFGVALLIIAIHAVPNRESRGRV